MPEDDEIEDDEIEEEIPVAKKKTKPKPAVVQIDNRETNSRLDKLIELLTPPAPPTQTEEEKKDGNETKEPTSKPGWGIDLFRNPFGKH